MIKQLEKYSRKYPVLLDELAHLYLDSGWTQKAMKTVDKHLKKCPESVTGMLVKALIHEEKGEFSEAENLYREILNREPRNIRAITRLAMLENDKSDSTDYWKKSLAAVDPLCPWIQAVKVKVKTTLIDRPVGLREEGYISEESAAVKTEDIEKSPEESQLDSIAPGTEMVKADETLPAPENAPPGVPPRSEENVSDSYNDFDQKLLKDLEELEKDSTLDAAATTEIKSDSIDGTMEASSESNKDVVEANNSNEMEIDQLESTLKSLETTLGAEPPVEKEEEFAPSTVEISELQRVYQEITQNTDKQTTPEAAISQQKLNTVTLARLYVNQGNLDKALEIFFSLPDEIRFQYVEEIQKLEELLNQNN